MCEGKIEILLGDCLELMKDIPNGSIDMILCDLPYGTTACKWDTIIPFEPLWEQYERIIKPNGAIVLTASQPFTSALVMSNPKSFKYEWIWDKCQCTNFYNAKKQPLKRHESILVFNTNIYFPQKEKIKDNDYRYRKNGRNSPIKQGGVYGNIKQKNRVETGERYPNSILKISNTNAMGKNHPTEKSIILFEYLIKTYTNEGDLVLDNTAGSGTTAIACLNTNRQFIVMEKEQKYYDIILKRVGDFKKMPLQKSIFETEQ
jgi:DNA modification methylase